MYLEDLVQQGYLREYILTLEVTSKTEGWQKAPFPNRSQHMFTHYRVVD